jgi:EAL domain-containing protein (putative c-di-GMP-specific phosphodiesterase class I)
MSNAAQATWLLAQLRLHDVHLMLDDFGTGYSSLAYLHDYRFDALKIDRSFVARMASGRPAEIIRSIVSLARALGMEVVAEGVEQQGQADGLRELGVELAQGYHFSRPLAADRLEALLQAPLPVRATGL